MKCPVCRVSMYAAEHAGVEIDLCARCQGVWFDADELVLLVGHGEALDPAATTSDEAARRCPRCRRTMRKANIGPAHGVLIDVCPEGCGLWFDRDEVPALCRDLEADGVRLDPEVRRFVAEMFPASPDDG